MDKRETRCQFYLISPPLTDRDMATGLAAIVSSGNVACVLLRCDAGGVINREFAKEFMRITQDSQVPVLFENDGVAAGELGADGVHILADEAKYTECRRILGDDAIIGAECGTSRHDGLAFGEMGADYIALREADNPPEGWNAMELEDLITWWSQTVTVPCIAWDIFDAGAARRHARAGADFVAMGEPVWSHNNGPAEAVAEFSANLNIQKISA